MRKYTPVIISFIVLAVAGYIVVSKKHTKDTTETQGVQAGSVGAFGVQQTCARLPDFLRRLKIPQPVVIDLSQKQYKGIALHYGKDLEKTLHPIQWEQYAYLGTYATDKRGNIYIVPTPYISIDPATFNLQKNIYRLDTQTGKLGLWMHFDDVHPSASNPYGLSAIAYDCDDGTLWAAAIDESDYSRQKGVIYHIDPKHKTILQTLKGVDALSLQLLKNVRGKYLLLGSARDNALYAYPIKNQKITNEPIKLLALPNANEHIRKIKVTQNNRLELQSIPFSYTLIAQTSKKNRIVYDALWRPQKQWLLKKR